MSLNVHHGASKGDF